MKSSLNLEHNTVDSLPTEQLLLGYSSVPDVKTELHSEPDASKLSSELNMLTKEAKDSSFTPRVFKITPDDALSFMTSPKLRGHKKISQNFFRHRSQFLESRSIIMPPEPMFFSRDPRSERQHFSTAIDFALEPKYYYHSIGGMNPMKLTGILKHGILSKSEAEDRGLTIDSNGIACNGTYYVSTATHFGGCMDTGNGAFHFVIEREKLTTNIRKNPEQDMPTERQVYLHIPKNAIKAIQLEKEGFIDIEHPSIKLGVGCFADRATAQVSTYTNFMASDFGYKMPQEDAALIQKTLHEMKSASSKYSDYLKEREATKLLEANIETLIKKHLKICFKKVIMKDLITPYDILRHYDQNIPVYDHNGNDIKPPAQVIKDSLESKPSNEPSSNKQRITTDALMLTTSPGLLFDPEKNTSSKPPTDLITKSQTWAKDREWSDKDIQKFVSAISTIEKFNKDNITKILTELNWMNPEDIAEEYFNHINSTVSLYKKRS